MQSHQRGVLLQGDTAIERTPAPPLPRRHTPDTITLNERAGACVITKSYGRRLESLDRRRVL